MLFEVLGGAGSYTLGRRDPEEAVPQAALEDGSSGRAGAGRGTSGASGTVSLGSGRFCPRWRLRHIKKLRIGRFGAPGPPPKGSSPQARFVPPKRRPVFRHHGTVCGVGASNDTRWRSFG